MSWYWYGKYRQDLVWFEEISIPWYYRYTKSYQ
ncbi:hypothetical protein FOMG_19766 [Fusarium oxysporum f. sp. melonis 26406]|uniref:Uncharacterized protein n=1 Tax=Fusarium oxysporum f. sp. melonis 26406 TaxID=1089452 RepID=W9YWA3_FUSOX|nr:hypothetical protein FOMG_19766 [Fusarium oxysporum f. sp. melonis 26406]